MAPQGKSLPQELEIREKLLWKNEETRLLGLMEMIWFISPLLSHLCIPDTFVVAKKQKFHSWDAPPFFLRSLGVYLHNLRLTKPIFQNVWGGVGVVNNPLHNFKFSALFRVLFV